MQSANSITPETETLPAKPEELSYDLAYRAYSNISFSAERRAKDEQEGFADHINSFYARLAKEFTNEDQVTYLNSAIQEYKTAYLSKYGAYLSSLSRVASVMITGPARFPTARNQKRSNAADNRIAEFSEWREKAEKGIRQHLLSLHTNDQRIEAEWLAIGLDIKRSLGIIKDVDEGKAFWNRSAFVNSINGKVQTLAKNGQVELVEKALALVTQYNTSNIKPAITPKHKFWKLLEIAKENGATPCH
jgi:hypothetical protein